MKFIGKGILKTDKDFKKADHIASGEEIPAGAISKIRIEQLVKKGLVSDQGADDKKAEAEKKVAENLEKAKKEAKKKKKGDK